MNIVYIGGCWLPNIGNAFIDLGSMQSMGKYNPKFMSEMTSYHYGKMDLFDIMMNKDIDLVVFSGMMLCREFFDENRKLLNLLKKRNIKVLVNGGGGIKYDESEFNSVRENIKEYNNFIGLISRDHVAFEKYNDLFKHAYSGIDCAFFTSEVDRLNLNSSDGGYCIFNDDNSKHTRDMINHLQSIKYTGKTIKTRHKIVDGTIRSGCFVAEQPEEYIYLYNNADFVMTTRIHGCIISLTFDTKVKLFTTDKRSAIFDKFDKNIDENGFMTLNNQSFVDNKTKHRQSIEKFINEYC